MTVFYHGYANQIASYFYLFNCNNYFWSKECVINNGTVGGRKFHTRWFGVCKPKYKRVRCAGC